MHLKYGVIEAFDESVVDGEKTQCMHGAGKHQSGHWNRGWHKHIKIGPYLFRHEVREERGM